MFESGLLLAFLIPGLLAYCAVYGVFHNGKAIAPAVPSANSVESVTVIFLSSAAVHAVTAMLITANTAVCGQMPCLLHVSTAVVDPYATAFRAIDNGTISAKGVAMLIGGTLLQGGITYWLILQYLRHLARADKLPAWIYGWSVDIANSVDNASEIVIAYVLTNADKDDKSIVYGGVLYDIALKPDGCVSRITLWDCERYLADLSAKLPDPTLPEALSRFPFMLIESSNIRNIAFEVITSTETSATDEQDILTQAMTRLYAGSGALY